MCCNLLNGLLDAFLDLHGELLQVAGTRPPLRPTEGPMASSRASMRIKFLAETINGSSFS